MPEQTYPGPDEKIPQILRLPGPGDEVAARYDLVDTSIAPGVKLFRVVHRPPDPDQTPQQVEAQRRDTEDYYLTLSIMRLAAREAANRLGLPINCARRGCRRRKACIGDRHEFDWSFPGPWMPPCAGTLRLVERVREGMRALCAGAADGDGAGAGGGAGGGA